MIKKAGADLIMGEEYINKGKTGSVSNSQNAVIKNVGAGVPKVDPANSGSHNVISKERLIGLIDLRVNSLNEATGDVKKKVFLQYYEDARKRITEVYNIAEYIKKSKESVAQIRKKDKGSLTDEESKQSEEFRAKVEALKKTLENNTVFMCVPLYNKLGAAIQKPTITPDNKEAAEKIMKFLMFEKSYYINLYNVFHFNGKNSKK